MPKFNLYQSLHTTVVGPAGQAARGADPHPRDAPAGRVRRRRPLGLQGQPRADRRPASGCNRIVDWQPETSRPDRVHGQPEGRPRAGRGLRLHPEGQGHHPADGRHAGRLRLRHPHRGRPRAASAPGSTAAWCRSTPTLQSGDTVEIFTSKVGGAGPSRDWLQFVRHAAGPPNKIRQWFSRERREDAIETGREELIKALRREGLPGAEAPAVDVARRAWPTTLNYADLDALLRRHRRAPRLGQGGRRAHRQHARGRRPRARGAAPDHGAARPAGRPRRSAARQPGVHVEGLDDVMVRLSRCCTPVPGDEIMGFVTRGRGVSVHRTDCANAVSLVVGPDRPAHRRRVGRTTSRGTFVASIEVKALDRSRLLRDVAAALSRPPRQHPPLQHPHRHRPDRQDAVRLRARPTPSTSTRCSGHQADRQRVRRLPGPSRPRLTRAPIGCRAVRGRSSRPVRWPCRAPSTAPHGHPRHDDVLPPESDAGGAGRRPSPRPPAAPATASCSAPDVRGHRRVPPRGRGHRRRAQGDVRLRRQGRAPPGPAPRGHRVGRAGLSSQHRPTDARGRSGTPRRTSATSARRPAATASTTSSGVEVLGSTDPDLDVEVIAPAVGLLRRHRPAPGRPRRSTPWATADGPSSLHRRHPHLPARATSTTSTPTDAEKVGDHPMRVLDSKRPGHHRRHRRRRPASPTTSPTRASAHFERVQAGPRPRSASRSGIEPRLVRGLDYYTHTTFEFMQRRPRRGADHHRRRRPLRRARRVPRRAAHARHRLRLGHRARCCSPATPRASSRVPERRASTSSSSTSTGGDTRPRPHRRAAPGRHRRRARLRRPLHEVPDEGGRPLRRRARASSSASDELADGTSSPSATCAATTSSSSVERATVVGHGRPCCST